VSGWSDANFRQIKSIEELVKSEHSSD